MIGRHLERYNVIPSLDIIEEEIRRHYGYGLLRDEHAEELLEFLAECRSYSPAPQGFLWALDLTKETIRKHEVANSLAQAMARLNRGKIDEAIEIARHIVPSNLNTEMTSLRAISKDQRWEQYQATKKNPTYEPIGFPTYDARTGGFDRQEYLLLAALQGVGKSYLGTKMVTNYFRRGSHGLIISTEMSKRVYLNRIEGLCMGVNDKKIRMGNLGAVGEASYRRYLGDLANGSSAGDIHIVDGFAGKTLDQVGDVLHRIEDSTQKKIEIVLIDPFQHLYPACVNYDWQSLSTLSHHIKRFTTDENLLGVGTHQLNTPAGKTPTGRSENLRGAGAILDSPDVYWRINEPDKGLWSIEILKVREDEKDWSFLLHYDFSRGFIGESMEREPEVQAKPRTQRKKASP